MERFILWIDERKLQITYSKIKKYHIIPVPDPAFFAGSGTGMTHEGLEFKIE